MAIRAALGGMAESPLRDGALGLLDALGYRSDRTLLMGDSPKEFLRYFNSGSPPTPTPKELRMLSEKWQSAAMLAQITNAEICGQLGLDSSAFNEGIIKSFVFIAVDLQKGRHARGDLTRMTRMINKMFAMPAIMIFRGEGRATIAVIHRRENKRDATRDVLEKVTLIKDISLAEPHRAHLDILADISLSSLKEWMSQNNKPPTFDSLQEGWLEKLDAEKLNRKFYGDLFAWFEWAKGEVEFPSPPESPISAQEHIIRMVTRLLFVWFIKEKGLVADEFFIEAQAKPLLRNWNPDDGDNYYRAILQNLFFATLNTEINRRQFSGKSNATHRDFTCRRYRDLLADETHFEELMNRSPFINGGLFDCLDSHEGANKGGYRIDCFTDIENHRRRLRVPNRLFFGAKDGRPGLLDIFHKYKFTVEESTPIEQEVALDPELLGSVFENLLASLNRKETGSFYTPRRIVDYMADESLLAYFMDKMQPAENHRKQLRDRLLNLLSYESADDSHSLNADEIDALMKAIANARVLDPAVGSGAFPMGILQKLTNILNKIDPHNIRWRELQKDRAIAETKKAYNNQDKTERDRRTSEISETFERYADGFGRKVFLIQNSIFGVDIQPIACQIAKLRFFITLAIEQEPNQNPKDNYGIRPLPNLETRFVAADSLIGLGTPAQSVLGNEEVKQLENELSLVRERYFNARIRGEKRRLQKEDKNLRNKMARLLKSLGFEHQNAERIAAWDPYNQNAHADWFNSEWMFGVADGFDIVIGNPPYVRQESIKPKKYKEHLLRIYPDATGKSDLYVYFYLRALELLRDGGTHTFICSNSWLDVGYGAPLQNRLLKSTRTISIFHSEVEREFQTADINTIISVMQKGAPNDDSAVRFVTFKASMDTATLDSNLRREIVHTHRQLIADGTREKKYAGDKWGGKYLRAPDIYRTIMEKGAGKFVRLGNIADIRFGIKTGANDFFYLDESVIAQWGIEEEFLRPVVKSPRECESILVDPARLTNKIFMCHKERHELAGTNALAYIQWGEECGLENRPSCRGRSRWWDLGEQKSYDCIILRFRDKRNWTPINVTPTLLAGDAVFVAKIHRRDLLMATMAYLNSSLFVMMTEIYGRVNLGDGLLTTYGPDIMPLPVLSAKSMGAINGNELNSCFEKVKSRPVLSIFEEVKKEDRRQLDDLFFDVLDLTADERDAIYEAAIGMAQKRIDKARSKRVDERSP